MMIAFLEFVFLPAIEVIFWFWPSISHSASPLADANHDTGMHWHHYLSTLGKINKKEDSRYIGLLQALQFAGCHFTSIILIIGSFLGPGENVPVFAPEPVWFTTGCYPRIVAIWSTWQPASDSHGHI